MDLEIVKTSKKILVNITTRKISFKYKKYVNQVFYLFWVRAWGPNDGHNKLTKPFY